MKWERCDFNRRLGKCDTTRIVTELFLLRTTRLLHVSDNIPIKDLRGSCDFLSTRSRRSTIYFPATCDTHHSWQKWCIIKTTQLILNIINQLLTLYCPLVPIGFFNENKPPKERVWSTWVKLSPSQLCTLTLIFHHLQNNQRFQLTWERCSQDDWSHLPCYDRKRKMEPRTLDHHWFLLSSVTFCHWSQSFIGHILSSVTFCHLFPSFP